MVENEHRRYFDDMKQVAQETMESNDTIMRKCEQLELDNNILSMEKRNLRDQLNELKTKYSMAMSAIKDIESDHQEHNHHTTNFDFRHHNNQQLLDQSTQTDVAIKPDRDHGLMYY